MESPLFESRPKNFGIGKDISLKEISHTSSRGQLYQPYKGPPSISDSKYLPPLTGSPRPRTGKQLPSCLSMPARTGQRKSRRRRRSKGCWPTLRRKLLAKGISQLRDHLSFKRGQYSHHLEGEQKGSAGGDCP